MEPDRGEVERLDDTVLNRVIGQVVRYAIDGVGPFKGAADLVEPLRRKGFTTNAVITRLVRTQCTHATTQGAVTGLGGIVTAALGVVPATAASLFVQARLVAAIAYAQGHDLADPAVRARVADVVAGASAATSAKKVGMEVSERAARSVAPRLQARAVSRAATRAATGRATGTFTARVASGGATRAVPVVGALVGGAVDLAVTRRVAERARREFGPILPSPPLSH